MEIQQKRKRMKPIKPKKNNKGKKKQWPTKMINDSNIYNNIN